MSVASGGVVANVLFGNSSWRLERDNLGFRFVREGSAEGDH